MDAHTFTQQYTPSKDDSLSFMQQLRILVMDATGNLQEVLKTLATSPRSRTTPLTLDNILNVEPEVERVSEGDIIITTNEQFIVDASHFFSINSTIPVILLSEESDRDIRVRNANVFDVVPSKISPSSTVHTQFTSGDIPLVDTSRLEQALRYAAFFRYDMGELRAFFYNKILSPEQFLQDATMRHLLESCIAPSPELLRQEREAFRRKDTGITERDKFVNFPRRALYSPESMGNEISSMTAAYLLTHRALRELLLFPNPSIYARIIAHLAQQHYTLPITPYARRVDFAMEFLKTKVLGEFAEHIAIDAGFSTPKGRAFFFNLLEKFGYVPFSSNVHAVQHRSRILEIRAELPLGHRKMQRIRYKIGDLASINREQAIINSMNQVLSHIREYEKAIPEQQVTFPSFTSLIIPKVLTTVPEKALEHIINMPSAGETPQGRLVIKEVPGAPVIKYFMDAATAEMRSREPDVHLAGVSLSDATTDPRRFYRRQRGVRNSIVDGIAQVNALAYAVAVAHPELVRSVPSSLEEQKKAIKASIERKFIGNEESSREYPGFKGGLCELISDPWEVRSLRESILGTIDPVIDLYLSAAMGICTDRSGRNMLLDGGLINHVDFETLQRRPWILDLANAAEQCFSTYEHSIIENAIERFHTQLQQTLTAVARSLRRKNVLKLSPQSIQQLSDKYIQQHVLPTLENLRQSYPASAVLMDFAHFGTFMRYITTQPLTSNPIDHEINVYGAGRVLVGAAAHLSRIYARELVPGPDRKKVAELTSTVQRIYDSHFVPIYTPQQFRQRAP